MANLRLSTIYDYATLRLHRDGTRVQQSDENYNMPKRKKAVKDASGNWIAKDAGGLGMVNKTRYIRSDADDGGEYVSLGGGREEGGEKADEWVLLKKKPKMKQDYRTVKRRQFDANLDFLDAPRTASSSLAPTQEPRLEVPSSELLKSVHYFAASFYSDRGELLDLGKTYREKKKIKERSRYARKRRLRRIEEHERSHSNQESSDASQSKSTTSYLPEESLPDVRKKHQQDMYKVMNGSALMALGMIVQEHVASLVRGKIPDGWEEEMRWRVDESREDEVGGNGFNKSPDEEGMSKIGGDEIEPEAGANSNDEG
ncbi:hypothetical protein AX14_011152 [Amanita brunnescens Koide BX004]|nr:hypothetical protein AX14_011152 [Amanita brunnescens Koide BX004]